MTDLRLTHVTLENFRIQSRLDGQTLRLSFFGNADMDARAALGEFLEQVHEHVTKQPIRRVSCDFAELYFMSSACFKCFVVWVNSIVASDIERQYTVEFVRSRKLSWQARSLESLRYFGPAIVVIAASA